MIFKRDQTETKNTTGKRHKGKNEKRQNQNTTGKKLSKRDETEEIS